MCLKPRSLPPIPDDTRAVAERIYPPDHPLRRLGEDYADVLCDEDFADLYSPTGQPALSPALLALVTVLQATEHCSDRIATEMVRSRIDWKYALHLPLCYPGFDASILCEFWQRLVAHHAERRVFDAFLRRLKERGFLKGRAVQRTDSLAIIAAVRELDLLELVMETLRLALEAVLRVFRQLGLQLRDAPPLLASVIRAMGLSGMVISCECMIIDLLRQSARFEMRDLCFSAIRLARRWRRTPTPPRWRGDLRRQHVPWEGSCCRESFAVAAPLHLPP